MSHSWNKPIIGRVPIEHKPEDFLDKGENLVKKPSIGERIKQEAHEAKEWLKARITPENSIPVPSSDKVLRRTEGHTMHGDHRIPEHYDINKLPGHYDPDFNKPAPIAPSNQLHNIDLAAPSSHEMAGPKATNAFLLADKQRVFEERKETAPLARVGPEQREMITKATKPVEHSKYSDQLHEKIADTLEAARSKVVDAKDWVGEKVATSESSKNSSDKLKSQVVGSKENIQGKASDFKDGAKEESDKGYKGNNEKTLTETIKDSAASNWETLKNKAAEASDWIEKKLPSDSEKMSGNIQETTHVFKREGKEDIADGVQKTKETLHE